MTTGSDARGAVFEAAADRQLVQIPLGKADRGVVSVRQPMMVVLALHSVRTLVASLLLLMLMSPW